MGILSSRTWLALWNPVLRSLGIFAGTLALAVTFWLSPASRGLRTWLEGFLAYTSGTFLSWFDRSVSVLGSVVTVQDFSAEIIPACTGLFSTSIYVAAVLAYPASIKSKLQGIALGVLGILALNWVRIVSLLLLGAYYPPAFEFVHLVLWRSVVIFFALFLWLYWARRFAHAAA
jgi:exosortase H (IPTLxxWG-CTERM-specific)